MKTKQMKNKQKEARMGKGGEDAIPKARLKNLTKQRASFHISQKPRLDTCTLGGFEHFFIIGDEHGSSDFCASDEHIVKATGLGHDRQRNGLRTKRLFIDHGCQASHKISGLFCCCVISGKPGYDSSYFNKSHVRDGKGMLALKNFIDDPRSDLEQSGLLLKDSVFLGTPWRETSFDECSGIERIVHTSYSLFRIDRINLVVSKSSLTFEANSSLISWGDILASFGCRASSNTCNSLSINSSRFLMDFSSNCAIVSPRGNSYLSYLKVSCSLENENDLEKSTSSSTGTFVFIDDDYFDSNTARCPYDFKKRLSSFGMFSSSRNFRVSDTRVSAYYLGRPLQGIFDHGLGESRIVISNDLLSANSSYDELNDVAYHDSCSLEGWLAMADFTIRDNVLADLDSHKSKVCSTVYKNYAGGASIC